MIANAMKRAINPCFQIGCDSTYHWQITVHFIAISTHRHWAMFVAQADQICEFVAVITSNRSARCDAIANKLINSSSCFIR